MKVYLFFCNNEHIGEEAVQETMSATAELTVIIDQARILRRTLWKKKGPGEPGP